MFKAKINPRRVITTGGTLFCALGIGYLMQSNAQEAVPETSGIDAPQVDMTPLAQAGAAPLKISEITLTSAILAPVAPQAEPVLLPDAPVVLAALASDDPIAEFPAEEVSPTFACEHKVTAEPDAAAMVTLKIDAPCLANDSFSVHHNGMMFSGVADENGHSTLSVPALSTNAVYIVSFANGDGAVASTTVTSLEYYDRVVVQWTGEAGIQIHALEYGAQYHQSGHVWSGEARDMTVAARGEGGFVTRLGDGGLTGAQRAEVYTFPSGMTPREGDIALSLELEVTQANCGRDIEAQSIQLDRSGQLKVQDILLAVPDCTATGDFLVLKNLLNDLKIARN